jgi:hypothetical protein
MGRPFASQNAISLRCSGPGSTIAALGDPEAIRESEARQNAPKRKIRYVENYEGELDIAG